MALTKVIRVFLDAQTLKAGIILADLPGLHDVNLARVSSTKQYLPRCDHVFVVTTISRTISDQDLHSIVFVGPGKAISLVKMRKIDKRRQDAMESENTNLEKKIKLEEKKSLAEARNEYIRVELRQMCFEGVLYSK